MDFTPTRKAALARLAAFLPSAGHRYAETRNADGGPLQGGRSNVSQLSPWLHAGLIGEPEVLAAVLAQHAPDAAKKFIAEVFWRIYFKGYLEQRPAIWEDYCSGRDSAFASLASDAGLGTAYRQASQGRTGIEAFDVWARELAETGYLHNHARMWFASIWIFTLKLDWRLGADLFLRHLIDADAASNTLSWRWIAGLHTRGKHYLARAENIARYTAGRTDGPLSAAGLAEHAEPLSEPQDYPRQMLDLAAPVAAAELAPPFALLLHEEASHHAPLALPTRPALVIGATRPDGRSPGQTGALARNFARGAIAHGMSEAAAAFDCPAFEWREGDAIGPLLAAAGIERIAVPYLTTGWTRDALWPDLAPLAAKGRLVTLLGELDRATWPLAKAGFFPVAKAVDGLLAQCEIGPAT
jgi:deoxyribodipyrimidine photo-lyase